MTNSTFSIEVAWWIDGVAQTVIACLGLAGNSLAIPVLMSNRLNSVFNKILLFLAIFDNIFIICSILEATRKNFQPINETHVYLFAYFLYQLQAIAIVSSILTTVVLALERFLAVSKPIAYHNATSGTNPWKRAMAYIVPVFIFSTIFSIPKFFETQVVQVEILDKSRSDNLKRKLLSLYIWGKQWGKLFRAWLHWNALRHQMSFEMSFMPPIGTLSSFFSASQWEAWNLFQMTSNGATRFKITKPLRPRPNETIFFESILEYISQLQRKMSLGCMTKKAPEVLYI